MAVASDPRRAAVERLASRAWSRLVAVARAEAGPDGAEDAVQDVLLRLAAGVGELPADEQRATAYAATAVRRAARAGAVRRGAVLDVEDDASPDDDVVERLETRRRLVAFARALDAVPSGLRRTLALDAAGWTRSEVAAATGLSERAVRRALEEHRAPVLAATLASLDGTDCERFADTLAAYGAGAGTPRPGGPVAAHLEVCDACAAGLRRAAAVRRTLRAALGAPLAPAALATLGGGTALLSALKLPLAVLAIGAAATAGTVAALREADGTPPRRAPTEASRPSKPAAPPVPVPHAAPPITAPVRPAAPAIPAARPVSPAPAPVAPRAVPRPAIREGTAQRPRRRAAPASATPATAPARPASRRAAPSEKPPPVRSTPCAQQGLCAP
jgi:RNA polymerase sigma factor (sigma-70 family)